MSNVLVTDLADVPAALKEHGVAHTYLLGCPITLKHDARAAGLPESRIIGGEQEDALAALEATLFKGAKPAPKPKANPKPKAPSKDEE